MADRICNLEGVDEDLLVRLAQHNPTALQMELLRSRAAIENRFGIEMWEKTMPILKTKFLDRLNASNLPHLNDLDDETLAHFARLNPNSIQLCILRTKGAVQAFVRLHSPAATYLSPMEQAPLTDEVVTDNPVGRLQELVHPVMPLYIFTSHAHTHSDHLILCECSVNTLKSTGQGPNKRTAKHHAAQDMIKLWSMEKTK